MKSSIYPAHCQAHRLGPTSNSGCDSKVVTARSHRGGRLCVHGRGVSTGPLTPILVMVNHTGSSCPAVPSRGEEPGDGLGGGRFMEVRVRGLAVRLTSILSVSRTVLLWFGPQDTMQTIPQPCKAWGRPGWAEVGGRPSRPSCWDVPPPSSEPSGAGPGQRQVGRGCGTGREWADTTSLFLPGASASSTQWPSPAGSCNNRARPARSSSWTGWVPGPGPVRSERPVERALSLALGDMASRPA